MKIKERLQAHFPICSLKNPNINLKVFNELAKNNCENQWDEPMTKKKKKKSYTCFFNLKESG